MQHVCRFILFLMVAGHQVQSNYLQNDAASCSYGENPCDNGQCIHWKSWCDGPQDCDDGSDERYCLIGNPDDPKATSLLNDCSPEKHFRCGNGMCIPKAARCDDYPNCENREDEEGCDYSYEDLPEADKFLASTTIPPSTTTEPPSTTTMPPSTTTMPPTITTKPPSTTTKSPSSTTKPPPLVIYGDPPSNIPSRIDILRKSVQHLLNTRDAYRGWGDLTPRIVTAISLANESYFDFDNHDGFMTKQDLHLKVAVYLGKFEAESLRHPEKLPKVADLAHIVNALIATGQNPTNFYHWDVVKKLKKAMNLLQAKKKFVDPEAHLALCNANMLSDFYLPKIKNMAYRRTPEAYWLDVQAYALLVISCATQGNTAKIDEWKSLKMDVARNISDWQQSDGSFGTLHTTALVLQALIAADVPVTARSMDRAMNYILHKQDRKGSFGKNLDNYYVLPALNMKSLADIRKMNFKVNLDGPQNTEGVKHAKRNQLINVHYSLWIGGEKPEMQAITVTVPRRSNFLQVMAAAEKMNPIYKYELLKTAQGNVLHSIAGRVTDTEKKTYWTLYRKVPLAYRTPQLANVTETSERLKFLGAKKWTRGLGNLYPKNQEHLVFWYKPYF